MKEITMDFKTFIATIDVSSRPKRQAAIKLSMGLLEKIRLAEEAVLRNTPENFIESEAYAITESAVDILYDVNGYLECLYD